VATTLEIPSGPPGHFLLGHVTDFKNDPIGLFTRCARDYGDFVPLRFGPKRMIFVSNPEVVDTVLVANVRNFVKSAQFKALEAILGNGLVLAEGDHWRRQRRLMQPAFHRERIAGYGQMMTDYTEAAIDAWPKGGVLDMHAEMTRLTMEIVAKTLLDVDVRDDASSLGDLLTRAFESFNARMNSLWLFLPDSIPIPTNVKLHRAVRQLDAFMYRVIAERRAGGGDRGDLLSMLMDARDEDGSQMSDRQLRDEAVTLFGAGHETTATTLSWALYLVANHTQVWERLAAEVDEVTGGRPPSAGDLPQLTYCDMVLNETLRLYPAVAGLGREAVDDCELGGYPVAGGTSLFLSMWTLHRDPRYFEEPERFLPERWEDGLENRIPRFAFFPFSGGPRQCIGASFAMMEATLVLAAIVQRYRFTLVPGQTIEPWVIPTMRPKRGINMVIAPR